MLEEHCYITDASITTFKNELFNDLVVLQTKMINVIAKFWCWKHGQKKQLSVVERSKILTLHEVRHWETLFPKNWSSARLQSIRQLPDSRRLLVFWTWTGLVGPRLPVKVKKMVVHSPTTSSKKIRPHLLLTGADGSTSTIKRHFSDSFGLRVYKPARKRKLTPSMKAKRCAFAKPHLDWTT